MLIWYKVAVVPTWSGQAIIHGERVLINDSPSLCWWPEGLTAYAREPRPMWTRVVVTAASAP